MAGYVRAEPSSNKAICIGVINRVSPKRLNAEIVAPSSGGVCNKYKSTAARNMCPGPSLMLGGYIRLHAQPFDCFTRVFEQSEWQTLTFGKLNARLIFTHRTWLSYISYLKLLAASG